MMKTQIKINRKCQGKAMGYMTLIFGMFLLAACEINDPVADISRQGKIAANVYWDIPLTNVTAGNEVSFYAEYWSVDNTFKYLGVWYDIMRNLSYTLTYPGNGYSLSLDSVERVREFQEIITFEHNQGNYSADKKAYIINEKFPVSYTLSSLEYKNPLVYNQVQFEKLIPAGIRDKFRQGLFAQLAYQDLKNLLVTDGKLVTDARLEAWFDTVTEGDVVKRTLKTDSLAAVKSQYAQLPFSLLIYNKNRQYYAVEFTQGYQLNSRFRIVNGNNVENLSDVKLITVF